MTAVPNRITDRHRELARTLVEARESIRGSRRTGKTNLLEAHLALIAGWRNCPTNINAAVESAHAILEHQVIRRHKRPHGSGRHRNRVFRAPDELWDAAGAVAQARGVTLASVLCAALEHLVSEEPANSTSSSARR